MNASNTKLPVALGVSVGLIVAAVVKACTYSAACPFTSELSQHLNETLKNRRKRDYYLVPSVSG